MTDIEKIRKLAENGDANAMYELGALYHNGRGTEQDFKEAMKWYRKAADMGNVWAMLNVGLMYFEGWGVKKDYDEAMKWYRKAMRTGIA